MVFLRGGCDTLNLLVPHADSFYYETRPNIAVPAPDAANPLSALRIDDRWGLHPLLGESLMPLFDKGQLAFVPFAGNPQGSRSHFEAQDLIELAQSAGQRKDYGVGFLNRLVERLQAGKGDPRGVSFTQNLPLAFKGRQQVSNVPASGGGVRTLSEEHHERISALYEGHSLQPVVDEALGNRQEIAQALAREMVESARGAQQPAGLERSAAGIARVLRSRPEYSVAFLDVGGWDTHAGQGGAAGFLANRLSSLGRALATLRGELGDDWSNTVVMVMTEFGRTFRENGNRGTDHGNGSTMLLLGGGVRGGVLGEQVALDAAHLNENRDLPVLNDYRQVLGSLFGDLFALNAGDLAHVFPGVTRSSLRVV